MGTRFRGEFSWGADDLTAFVKINSVLIDWDAVVTARLSLGHILRQFFALSTLYQIRYRQLTYKSSVKDVLLILRNLKVHYTTISVKKWQ